MLRDEIDKSECEADELIQVCGIESFVFSDAEENIVGLDGGFSGFHEKFHHAVVDHIVDPAFVLSGDVEHAAELGGFEIDVTETEGGLDAV